MFNKSNRNETSMSDFLSLLFSPNNLKAMKTLVGTEVNASLDKSESLESNFRVSSEKTSSLQET